MSDSAKKKMSVNHANVAGSKNPRWGGGKRLSTDGYVLIWKPKHPRTSFHGYVLKHRLVMEKKLGRYLFPQEIVHHIDGNKENNKIKNLLLFPSASEHQKLHAKQRKNKQNALSGILLEL